MRDLERHSGHQNYPEQKQLPESESNNNSVYDILKQKKDVAVNKLREFANPTEDFNTTNFGRE